MTRITSSFIILIAAFVCSIQLHAQQITRYYDYKRSPAEPAKAYYYSYMDFKDSLWIENSYFVHNNKFRMYGRYRDSLGKIPVDTFYYFHNNGSLDKKGNHVNGKRQGLWLGYHDNGRRRSAIVYEDGKPVNTSYSWHDNGQLKDSIYWAPGSGGNSNSWTREGLPDATGHYNNDEKKDGDWKYYYTNGQPSSIEVYAADSLRSIQTFDEAGNRTPNAGARTQVEKESEYVGGQAGWRQHLTRTFSYPKQAVDREIEGTVIVQFIVDEKGDLSEIQALSGHPLLAEEAIRVIQRSGRWTPAISHGRKVKSYKKQPITFRLQ